MLIDEVIEVIWEKPGSENTRATAELALQEAEKRGISHLVIASNSGQTMAHFLAAEQQLVCVTHHVGFHQPGEDEMTAEMRGRLKSEGVEVLTTTHLLAGVDRAVRVKAGGLYPAEIMAHSLRLLGQGVKVCVEIAVMALDAGLIPYGEDIIAVGGTGRGADTACIIRPAHANNFFATKVQEIICKPRLTD